MSSSMSIVEARLPPGFRFHPRDQELVLDYLCRKLSGRGAGGGVDMVDVDLNKCEPWELPDAARVGGREWYFFSLHDRKYASGQRTNRATHSGYWKATGKDRVIAGAGGTVVGMRKTLVFYRGRAPRGTKTEWVMHEFRAEEGSPAVRHRLAGSDDQPHRLSPLLREDWVLCRVFDKSTTAAATRPASVSDESSGSLSGELAVAPALLSPINAAVVGYGQQDSTGLIPAAHHWPAAAPLPFKSFRVRDLLGDMVQGSGGDLQPDWSVDSGYTCQGGMSQTWHPF